MNQNLLQGKTLFYFLVFAGISPLTFYFNQDGFTFLIGSSYAFVVWTLLFIGALLLWTENTLSKKQLLALTIFYSCLPLSAYFSENHAEFVLLNQSPLTAVLLWIISMGLLFKFFRKKENQFHDHKA